MLTPVHAQVKRGFSSKDNKIASPEDLQFESSLEIVKLFDEMFDAMYKTDGIGLSAPQVGINVQLMVFNPVGKRVALSDCVDQISESMDELSKTLQKLKHLRRETFGFQTSNAQTWVGAAAVQGLFKGANPSLTVIDSRTRHIYGKTQIRFLKIFIADSIPELQTLLSEGESDAFVRIYSPYGLSKTKGLASPMGHQQEELGGKMKIIDLGSPFKDNNGETLAELNVIADEFKKQASDNFYRWRAPMVLPLGNRLSRE
ncbi:Peptide deformylase 1B [Hibiscus syriacus]|uniref:Peptide deformylase n=1 Tax=Hibiscus syriacus TaxID=106335 RepID=A0A6A2YMX5_HIBSY|nr:Peptide deformylase 1B [Hibiscus syriacus]